MNYQDFLRESNKAELISFINNYAESIATAKKGHFQTPEQFFNATNKAAEKPESVA